MRKARIRPFLFLSIPFPGRDGEGAATHKLEASAMLETGDPVVCTTNFGIN